MPNIKVEKIGKRKWKTLARFHMVPANFETDGASVWRPLWWFIDPAGEAFEASVVHDYLLSIKSSLASDEFYKYLLLYKVTPWKAYIAYKAVDIYQNFKKLIG